MEVTFLGATHEVTGSCTYLAACDKHLLIDYGMEQGKNTFENEPLPILPSEIDYVLLTHAHIDHSGLLPLLFKNGFHGEVHSTVTTKNLSDIMLLDSAHIPESDAEWKSRKAIRRGAAPVEPLYDTHDAQGVLGLFRGHRYNDRFTLAEGIDIRFTDAGHLLGSSSIEIWLTENGETRKIVFSGDIGNINQPLLRDPQFLAEADYAVMESTYGDREHTPPLDYASALAEVLQRTLDRGGNVVIPSFAVGRTQEMLYFIRHIKEQGLVHGHDGFPVYVDSPLAIQATRVFVDNAEYCYDEEATALLQRGINPIGFSGLITASTADESIAINTEPTPKVIISASGMCEAGRIRHHLKHNLWRPESTVLFVGYQANGTLGRALVEGAKELKIFGESIAVQAEILSLPGISGHGDVHELLRWIRHFSPKPRMTFINHGEDAACAGLAKRLSEEFGIPAIAPYSGTCFDLLTGKPLRLTEGIPVREKPESLSAQSTASAAAAAEKPSPKSAYAKLLLALERLTNLIGAGGNKSNRDLENMTQRINDLCNDWTKRRR